MNRLFILSKLTLALFFAVLLSSFSRADKEISTNNGTSTYLSIYNQLTGANKPDFNLFEKAYLGYIDLKLSGHISPNKEILSIIDFRIPSNKERLWVIDLKSKTILHNTLVAHGEKSGTNYALDFSNDLNSHKSSLGFYITQETYIGKNGLSLKLQGMEAEFNSNARKRYVVIHGAKYATKDYLKKHGSLGNSEGCPAVPMGEHKSIIEITKQGTCLFIYFPDLAYQERSMFFMNDFN